MQQVLSFTLAVSLLSISFLVKRYAAIGEYHVYGADVDLPVSRRMIELARKPRDVAERIAWKNGESLFGSALRGH